MARKLNIFFVFLLVTCCSTDSTIVKAKSTSTTIIQNSTTTSTNVPPLALDSINTSTTTTTLPVFTVEENCEENYPKKSRQNTSCQDFQRAEMWNRCKNPLSKDCFLEYNPTEAIYWEMGVPFWSEQFVTIHNWSKHYARYNLAWPQELNHIVGSPAFSIRDNGEDYDCYLLGAASMKAWLVAVIGIYPKPIEFSDSGPRFLGTDIWWTCNNGGKNNYTHRIGGPPILRGDFGNIDPNMRNARWTAYGVSDENWPYAEEFEISHFYWWFEDGFSIKEFCKGGLDNFTYEEDYESVCS